MRQAANSIGNQRNHPMTPFFNRVAFKKGREAAVTATARKLSVSVYKMITKKESYQPFDYASQLQTSKTTQMKKLALKLSSLKLEKEELKTMFESLTLSAT